MNVAPIVVAVDHTGGPGVSVDVLLRIESDQLVIALDRETARSLARSLNEAAEAAHELELGLVDQVERIWA